MSTSDHKQIVDLLGSEAEALLSYTAKGFPKESLHLPGPDFVDRVVVAHATARRRCCGTFNRSSTTAGSAGTGLRVDPAGRPGDRALRRRELRPEPDLLRPRKHRQAGDRGRLQRRRLDARRAGLGRAASTPTRSRSSSSSITTSC